VHSRRVRAALQAAADPLVIDLGYGAMSASSALRSIPNE
jgi:hypothetical protein